MSHVSRDLTGLLGRLNEEESELEASFVPSMPEFFTYSKLSKVPLPLPDGYTVSAVDPKTIIRKAVPVPPYKATREGVQATITRWLTDHDELWYQRGIKWCTSQLLDNLAGGGFGAIGCSAIDVACAVIAPTAWVDSVALAKVHLFRETRKINFGKGIGYGSSTDVLDNFRSAAKFFSWLPTPQDAVKFYMFKHVDFLCKLAATGVVHGEEGVGSRCADIVLYAALGVALDKEEGSNVQG